VIATDGAGPALLLPRHVHLYRRRATCRQVSVNCPAGGMGMRVFHNGFDVID
jgi:hypothetical protein